MNADREENVILLLENAMSEQTRTSETLDLISRLKVVLTRADLDCRCRDLLGGALDRFSDLEEKRLSRRSLTTARDHKERIAAILTLLSELNQITENERDRTVFVEMALLFDEIGHSAQIAAAALREFDPPRQDGTHTATPAANPPVELGRSA